MKLPASRLPLESYQPAAFIANYINPANADTAGLNALTAFVANYESARGIPVAGSLTPAAAWSIFQTLPANRQQFLVQQVLFGILNTTGLNYNNLSSPNYHQYSWSRRAAS